MDGRKTGLERLSYGGRGQEGKRLLASAADLFISSAHRLSATRCNCRSLPLQAFLLLHV